MYNFTDKVVVITGATSGIGCETAKQFAKMGAKLFVVGRNEQRGQQLVSDINGLNIKSWGGVSFKQCDVSNADSVRALAGEISRETDHIDVLFNNAGVMLPSCEIERMPIEDWKESFEINVNGIFYTTRFLKPMVFKEKGTIINNASIVGMHSYVIGRSYAYSASKAAVIQYTRQLAKNYAEDGIRVNCICPGIIDTPILGDRDRSVYAERIPLGYVGKPLDVAKVVLFLASDEASYITGAVIPIDGGVSL